MKLLIAVLSSILVACSVTIATPIDPSEITSTESSASTALPSMATTTYPSSLPTPDKNGIDLDNLVSLPSNIEDLLKEYLERRHSRNEQRKVCESIKSEYYDQHKLLSDLKKRIQALKGKSGKNGGSSKHNGKIRKVEFELEGQYFKLDKLKKGFEECKSKYDRLDFELKLVKIQLVECVFGEPWNVQSLNQKLSLIRVHPVFKGYLEGLCEKSSECKKGSDQDPSDHQQRLHLQPQTQSESRSFKQKASSFGQRASSSIRNAFSRLGDGFRSLIDRLRRIGCGNQSNRSEC
ncbi:hypothetical protein O5D80_002670 [Batrachochytrium dendrobatidis]|nr:hypothetical protein O5D80_002670 [Batrachochytrium dendrobatidis]